MRIVDENRAQNYIKKHRNNKRWLAFALCVSLFTGTVTLYLLNKPATAMTEDGAAQVGLVLETADSDFEMGLIEQMKDRESDAQKDTTVTDSSDNIVTVDVSQLGDGDLGDGETSKTWEDIIEAIPEDETGKNANAANSASSGEASAASSNASSNESTEAVSDSSSDADAASSASSDAAAATSASSAEVVKVDSLEDVKDVALTARYVDNSEKEIAQSGELFGADEENDKTALDFTKEYKVIENYYFVDAKYDGKKIVSLEKKTGEAEVKAEAKDSDKTDEAAALSASTDDEITSSDKKVKFTYFEAKTSEGEKIEIKKDAEIVFNYVAANTKESFEFKNDEVTVTVKLSKPGILPEGVALSVKTVDKNTEGYNYEAYIDALNKSAEEIAKTTGDDKQETYDENNVVLFDIAFMLDEIEYEPKDGTVSVSISFNNKQISDGLGTTDSEEVSLVHLPVAEEVMQELDTTSEATEITASDISVEILTGSNVELGGSKDVVSFETNAFSMYGAIKNSSEDSWDGNKIYTAKEIIKWLGDATFFGVVANYYDGGNNHSEANIAVNTIGKVQNYTIGISTQVLTTIDDFKITVEKVVKGSPKVGTFNFGLFSDVKGKTKINGGDFTITTDGNGKGTYTFDLSKLQKDNGTTYPRVYVYELDDEGNAVMDGDVSGAYKVTYGGDAIEAPADAVGFFSDNYIINMNGYDPVNVLEKVDGATIYYATGWDTYIGITYYQNQVYGKKPDGTMGYTNYVRTDYNKRMPVDIDTMRNQAREASQKLAYATSSGDVEVVNIVATKTNGDLQTDLSTKYFKNEQDKNNYAVNTGFNLSDDKILVINVDLTGATNYTLQKIKYNGKGTGDWSEAANHIVLNLVQRDTNGDFVPYTGSVTANIMSGTLIAPNATIRTTGSYSGTIVADSVIKECEIHKMDMRRYLDASADITITNEGNEEIVPFEIKAYKYVNDVEPDGNEVFDFTLRFLDANKKWKVVKTDLHNDSDVIKYAISNPSDELGMHYDNGKDNSTYYFLLTENDTTGYYEKDETGILVKVKYYPKRDIKGDVTRVIDEVNYYRVPAEGVTNMINSGTIDNTYNADKYRIKADREAKDGKEYGKVAFFNKNTKTTLLRIHKMVVNDLGSKVVRDAIDGTALLDTVMFRITNNDTGNYIILDGFIAEKGQIKTNPCYEYDAKTHKQTGKAYTATYNQSAQWTIEGLPSGIYTVEEVADGKTFTYNYDTNTSTVKEDTAVCRVTKYDVTVDDEETGLATYGTGGENYRKVFSCDFNSKSDKPPAVVKVGGAVQTVQVCNYYSSPVGPIQVTKNFTGGTWTDKMNFEFKLEAISCEAHDSEGNPISISKENIPMPAGGNTVTLTSSDATYDENTGRYTAVAEFDSIPYRYEGTYVYKITETPGDIKGVTYDSTVYYVEVKVSKKHTTFTNRHNIKNLTHPMADHNYGGKYDVDGQTVVTDDFFYLGADIRYATDEGFTNVIHECELYIKENPDTSKPEELKFLVRTKSGSVSDVAFNNSIAGKLTVVKEWYNSEGKKNQDSHTSLTLQIWQRTVDKDGNASDWKIYEGTTIQLSKDNKWKQKVENLPLQDEHGNSYEYCVKEPDEYLLTYQVSYSYGKDTKGNAKTYNGNAQSKITVGQSEVTDTGYAMSVKKNGTDYGTVTITNRSLVTNTLPSTGGIGEGPVRAFGIMLLAFALMGYGLYRISFRKKRN
ncbi:Spy0128 family protein [Butyrivibrio sp. VCB2006]|uniref:Spy0128 family protein n=1 Tax=Butyrivibrio sp. VCB2006 TaxID=1280679 RepID=UPI0003F4E39B|nr:FctA domain-containing protein [Butyrivibrio sp. VCB2006]